MKINFLFLIVTFLFVSSCEDYFSSIIDIDLPSTNPKLVLYSFIQEGEDTIYCTLSKTQNVFRDYSANAKYLFNSDTFWSASNSYGYNIFYDNNMDTISNAEITLYKNNLVIATFQKDTFRCVYKAILSPKIKFEPNISFKIKAKAPGYEAIESNQVVPKPVSVDSIHYSPNLSIIDPKNPVTNHIRDEFEIFFTDPPEKNYYSIGISGRNSNGKRIGTGSFSYDSRSNYDILEDHSFNANKTSWKVYTRGLPKLNNKGLDTLNITVSLMTITEESKSYAHYIAKFWKAFDDPFSEPVIPYSNIINGYGLFGISSLRNKTITIIR